MKTKVLIADDDMDVHQLMHDVLEIVIKNVKIERVMSINSFWEKISSGKNGEEPEWSLIFLCLEYVKEEPEGFIERIKTANPELPNKIVLVGQQEDFDVCGEDIRQLPFLAKPFSLDHFEETVTGITAPGRPRPTE